MNLDTQLFIGAVIKGYVEIVKNLINHGADICIQDNTGWSALHMAVSMCKYQCFDILTEQLSPSQEHQSIISLKDSGGRTALDIAEAQPNRGGYDKLISIMEKNILFNTMALVHK